MTRPVVRLTLVGTSPLLMHSASLLDPIHPVSLEIEAYHNSHKVAGRAPDHAHISDLEFVGALWLDRDRPCIPARTVLAALRQAAERRDVERRIRSAVFIDDDAVLSYDGPPTTQGLRSDPCFRLRSAVTIDGRRRMCTRPMFRAWSTTVAIAYETHIVARSDVVDLMMIAGDTIGIGAGRPRYGRFAVLPAD